MMISSSATRAGGSPRFYDPYRDGQRCVQSLCHDRLAVSAMLAGAEKLIGAMRKATVAIHVEPCTVSSGPQ